MPTEKGRSLLVLKSLPMKDKRLLCSLASALRGSSWQSNLNHLNPEEQQLALMRVLCSSGPCLPRPLPSSLMGFFFLFFSGHSETRIWPFKSLLSAIPSKTRFAAQLCAQEHNPLLQEAQLQYLSPILLYPCAVISASLPKCIPSSETWL